MIEKIGNYKIIKELGKGGMGSVYLAEDTRNGEKVAIKLIHPIYFLEPESLERFKEESVLIASLSHPNIIKVIEMGEEEGQPYVVMEYMDGGSISNLLNYGPIPIPQVYSILTSVFRGMYYSHSRGIFHADLKTSNILFKSNGEVKISDFGLGSLVLSSSEATGTPAYMAPEFIMERKVDDRSDIYSLGVVLYEMVTGRLPFKGESAYEVLQKHLKEIPAKPSKFVPDIPPLLENIILKAIHKNNTNRYQNIKEFVQDVEDLISSQRVEPFSPGTTIHIQSKPSGAEVYLDEVFKGLTPIKIVGNYEGKSRLILKKSRYLNEEMIIDYSPFKKIDLNFTLKSEGLPFYKTDLKIEPITSVSAIGDSLFVGTRSKELLELDTLTGNITVNLPLGKEVVGSIGFENGQILIATKDGSLLNLKTESLSSKLNNSYLSYQLKLEGEPVDGVHCSAGKAYVALKQGTLYSIRIDTGKIHYKLNQKSSIVKTFLSPDEIFYLLLKDGTIKAIDTLRGEEIWSYLLPINHASSLNYSKEILYVVAQEGVIYGFEGYKGENLFRKSIGKKIKSPSAIFEEMLILPSVEGIVYALKLDSQEIVWESVIATRFFNQDRLFVVTTGFNGFIHLVGTNGIWYKLDKTNGNLISETNLGGKFEVLPAKKDGIIYLIDTRGTVIALPLD